MNNNKILFFDDEAPTSYYVVRNLKTNFGHNITIVSSISSFIEQLNKEEEEYALLIIDIMAPIPPDLEQLGFEKNEIEEMLDGMNTGMILATRVWRMEKYKEVPVIFITAKDSPKMPKKNKCSIIRKPALAKNISEEINEMLNKKEGV